MYAYNSHIKPQPMVDDNIKPMGNQVRKKVSFFFIMMSPQYVCNFWVNLMLFKCTQITSKAALNQVLVIQVSFVAF